MARPHPFRFLLACCLLAAGCYGESHNPGLLRYLQPGGDVVRTHAKPPGRGYFEDFDPASCHLEVVPLEATSPARSQVVVVATVTDSDGKPLKNRRVEWMLEGAGNIVEVDESGYFPGRGYKVDNRYAVSYTDHLEHRIRRTRNPVDDFVVRPGQSWCVISSAVEGDSQVTVYAPEIADWNANRIVVTHHWVDAGFSLPPAVTARSGQQALLTTNVFRQTDHQPLAGYRVRYRIMDGPAAVLLPGQAVEAVVTSDINGNATAGLMQVQPGLGRNRVFLEVLRAPDPSLPSGSALGVARGETTVDWQSPAVSLAPAVPPTVAVGKEVPLALTVKNSSPVESQKLTVRAGIPQGATYVRSNPPADVEGNMLVWTLAALPGGTSRTLEAVFRPASAGTLTSLTRVETSEGLKDEKSVSVQVMPPPVPKLKVGLSGPAGAVIVVQDDKSAGSGVPATFLINVSNAGTGPATNVVLKADFDANLVHDKGAGKVELSVGTLEAGASQIVPLTLRPLKSGDAGIHVTATADGKLSDQADKRLAIQTARLTASVKSAGTRLVGKPVVFDVEVANAGEATLGDVTVHDLLPPELVFASAVPAATNPGVPGAARDIVWALGTLKPGDKKELQITASAGNITPKIVNAVQVSGYPLFPGDAKPANLPVPIQGHAEVALAVQGLPALRMTVTDLADPIEVGDRTTYRIQVVNQGTLPASQVSITGVIPAQMQFVGVQGNVRYRQEGQRVIFEPLASLGVGQAVAVAIDVKATQAGSAVFQAELSGGMLQNPLLKQESTTVK